MRVLLENRLMLPPHPLPGGEGIFVHPHLSLPDGEGIKGRGRRGVKKN
jgi:hypothetical protein